MFSWAPDLPSFQRGVASVRWCRKFGFNFHFETHGYYSPKKSWHTEDVQVFFLQKLPTAPTGCEALAALRGCQSRDIRSQLLPSSFEVRQGYWWTFLPPNPESRNLHVEFAFIEMIVMIWGRIIAAIRKITGPAVHCTLSMYPGLFQSNLIYYFIISRI